MGPALPKRLHEHAAEEIRSQLWVDISQHHAAGWESAHLHGDPHHVSANRIFSLTGRALLNDDLDPQCGEGAEPSPIHIPSLHFHLPSFQLLAHPQQHYFWPLIDVWDGVFLAMVCAPGYSASFCGKLSRGLYVGGHVDNGV